MKVKDIKKIFDGFGDELNELEVCRQERTPGTPFHPLYTMCSMDDFNIGIQQNGRVIYLAIGDVVHKGDVGFAEADGSEIKYVNPKNKHSTNN